MVGGGYDSAIRNRCGESISFLGGWEVILYSKVLGLVILFRAASY